MSLNSEKIESEDITEIVSKVTTNVESEEEIIVYETIIIVSDSFSLSTVLSAADC